MKVLQLYSKNIKIGFENGIKKMRIMK